MPDATKQQRYRKQKQTRKKDEHCLAKQGTTNNPETPEDVRQPTDKNEEPNVRASVAVEGEVLYSNA